MLTRMLVCRWFASVGVLICWQSAMAVDGYHSVDSTFSQVGYTYGDGVVPTTDPVPAATHYVGGEEPAAVEAARAQQSRPE